MVSATDPYGSILGFLDRPVDMIEINFYKTLEGVHH
jgi:hypothetical protein